MNTGKSVLDPRGTTNYTTVGGGGNSGALISRSPGLGMSAYQTPEMPEENKKVKGEVDGED